MPNQEPVSEPTTDRLAAEMPDPSGPPQPVKTDDPVLRGIANVGVVLVAAGGVLLPVFGSVGHTAGATRSTKLQWEYRQQQIERTIQREQTDRAQAAPETDDEGNANERDGN